MFLFGFFDDVGTTCLVAFYAVGKAYLKLNY